MFNMRGIILGFVALLVLCGAAVSQPFGYVVGPSGGCVLVTGSGGCVGQTSPTLITPVLGVATGTSLALTNSSSLFASATLINTNSADGTFTSTYQGLAPNLTATHTTGFALGVANSTNNLTSLGFYYAGSGSTSNGFTVSFYNNNDIIAVMANNTVTLQSTGVFGFNSAADAIGTLDTAFSRDGAGIVDVGTGAQGSKAGSMKMTGLTASGTITFAGVTTGTNADFACFAAGGVMTLQTSACTISSARFKTEITPYRLALSDAVYRMPVVTFRLKDGAKNKDPNARVVQMGLIAESVAKIMPLCAIYENDMKTPKSYRQECLIAALVKTVQEQHAANDNLARRVAVLERRR